MIKIVIHDSEKGIAVREVSDPSHVYGLSIVGYLPDQDSLPDTRENVELLRAINNRIRSRTPRIEALSC